MNQRSSNVDRQYQRRIAEAMWGGFFHCPTTGRILEQLPGDDKVMCNCGKSNPKVLQESTEQTGVHIVKFLKPATVDEYLDQEEARHATRH